MSLVENSTQDGRSQYSDDAFQFERPRPYESDTENAGQIRIRLCVQESAQEIYKAICQGALVRADTCTDAQCMAAPKEAQVHQAIRKGLLPLADSPSKQSHP